MSTVHVSTRSDGSSSHLASSATTPLPCRSSPFWWRDSGHHGRGSLLLAMAGGAVVGMALRTMSARVHGSNEGAGLASSLIGVPATVVSLVAAVRALPASPSTNGASAAPRRRRHATEVATCGRNISDVHRAGPVVADPSAARLVLLSARLRVGRRRSAVRVAANDGGTGR